MEARGVTFPKSSVVNWALYRPGPWLISYVGNRQAQITSELGTANTVHLLWRGLCCPHEGRSHSPAGPGRNSGTPEWGRIGEEWESRSPLQPTPPRQGLGELVEVREPVSPVDCRAWNWVQGPGSESRD